jgi:histidinol-phosphate aminotransferase
MVLRTFSKLGWAGLRLGYLLGDAESIGHLNKVRMPYNINALTQASADFLLDHFDVFEQQATEICAERKRVMAAFMAMDDIHAFPSQANFILIRVADADAIFDRLKTDGILVKNMNGAGGLLTDCLRITIGTRDENDAVLAAVREIIA